MLWRWLLLPDRILYCRNLLCVKLGDAIAAAAQPIARGIDRKLGTNIAGCPGCREMRDNLNTGMSLHDAIYYRWFKAKKEGVKMEYQIVVVVKADKASEAVAKAESIGEVVAIKAMPSQEPK